ncbi:hypothetical protein RJ639_032583 [Escallonia herrerae]|uniref:Isopenicillin N synthase-like Fe(2+) 2OG dioxygenase domain-containing protein n=1 Tax=Escallonia herrerae TaxID=1293975 RepID=A0AA88WVZ7_9ASTE|nr:hypothetical protein RJ639_032583 [Escallonia herrerae]
MDSPDPPFQDTYKTLFSNFNEELPKNGARPLIVEEKDLPYRWGTPSATCLRQLAWSEAFHVPLTDISGLGGLTNLSFSIVTDQLNNGTLCCYSFRPSTEVSRNLGRELGSQAWSNDVYKSVEHRVVTNKAVERFSTAYFFCPSYESVIQSCAEPPVYKKFSFREFRQQVQDDVKKLGHKIGLPRFIL